MGLDGLGVFFVVFFPRGRSILPVRFVAMICRVM